ncbi:MAG: ribosome-binding factor A [Acidimicrobiales bacterium]
MSRRSHRTQGPARDFPRTARLNHLVHEIVAEELERLDDERLGFFTVVAVEVEPDMRHATVWYTSLSEGDDPEALGKAEGGDAGSDGDHAVVGALADHRARLQSAIARQAHLRRTPELVFRPDTVIRQAARLEEILREIGSEDG